MALAPTDGPILIAGQDPTEEGNRTCPGMGGGHNWQGTAYSPQTGLYYLTVSDRCMAFFKTDQTFVEGQLVPGEHGWARRSGPAAGSSRSTRNPATSRGTSTSVSYPTGGVLATAGGLVFTGDQEGYVIAFDGRNGKVLWRFQTGGNIIAPPITYSLEGRQYISIAAGQSMLTFALPK